MKRFLLAMLVLGSGIVFGCASVAPPPPVDQAMKDLAADRGMDPGGLEAGRHLYLTRCTGCHGNVRPERYDPLEWRKIMDRMAPQAGLDPDQQDDLEDYLDLVRASTAPSGP